MSEEEVLSLRDELEISIDEAEEAGRPEEDAEEPVGAEAEEEARARDEHGRFAPKEEPADPEAPAAEPVDNPPPDVDNLQSGPQDEQPQVRAPASWKPVAQQEWGKLPQTVREEVMRREHDVQRFLQESAPTRKMGEQLMEAAQPFREMIESEGSNPVQAARSMFETAAILKTGSPIQKASMLSQIITQYNVPLELLDTVLSEAMRTGQMPQVDQAPPQPQVDPQQIAQQVRSELQQEQELAMATDEVAAFIQQNPAAGYLRNEMADLVDAYPGMSLQEAFDNAILRHPQLAQLNQPQQAAPTQETQQARSKRAKRAASSVKSSPTTGAKSAPDTLRGALEEAFEDAG